MSTTGNFNSPSSYENPNNNGSKRGLTIAGIVIAALLGASIFLGIGRYQANQQLAAVQTQLTGQIEATAQLEAQYTETKTKLEEQLGLNAQLDEKIQQQLAELEGKKKQIQGLIRTNKNSQAAIAEMKGKESQFLAEIEQLKKDNGILAEKNTQLTTEVGTLTTTLGETKVKLEEETTAKATLISEKTQLEGERTVLTKKVDVASAVKTNNIQVKSVDVRKNGKEKEKARAKKVEKLNICFTTEANEVVPAGEETFYVRIIDPSGAPLAIESLGSGVAQDKKSSSDVRYTVSTTCQYANAATNVCAAWLPGQDFAKGKYGIEIYNKGYLVGTSSFNLK